jgi:hypothetical protein
MAAERKQDGRSTTARPELVQSQPVGLQEDGCVQERVQYQGQTHGERAAAGAGRGLRGSFAPGSEHAIRITLLSKVPAEDMELHQMEIKSAFLQWDLEEVAYSQQTLGFGQGEEGQMCQLTRSLWAETGTPGMETGADVAATGTEGQTLRSRSHSVGTAQNLGSTLLHQWCMWTCSVVSARRERASVHA